MNKTPVSEINAEEFANFIQQEKDQLKEIEGDIKDAKRRISAAKNGGPKNEMPIRRLNQMEVIFLMKPKTHISMGTRMSVLFNFDQMTS